MMPGRASAAFIPNFPSSDAKALSWFLIHPFKPFSSLGGGEPPPEISPPLPGNNASTNTPIGHLDSHEYGSNSNFLLSKQSSDLST